ncbi:MULTISPECIES: sigma-70 family RNA polymerase sigma factor [unclassified Pedobacter]|uniref:sigma-70 family RNA polymerase sigma factor n=1 Tax=unclassified Pedobacter TaxID=2628915 RepID=UPI00141DF966|nr:MULTISPECIES: sigma-70 family RNA polymerase sigma factor [unclassified Pedobacter]NII85301.1 RNA polymerase sigma-70 factor (ECF subfamily) [Pedobacter sp. SG908]NMN39784.1 RNA polymerase sigma-70 factor (ECF subfamily) [Pedobacter sp. SG918]
MTHPEPEKSEDLIKRLKLGDKQAYEKIYFTYSNELLLAAYKKTGDKVIAEELVQNIFISLWEKRERTGINNLQAYLFGALKLSVINYIRSLVMQNKYMEYQTLTYSENHQDTANLVDLHDLSSIIEEGINSLPEKTQEVFRLSRYQHQSTKDISTGLNISEKAVEYHITQSIKRIKEYIKNFYIFL